MRAAGLRGLDLSTDGKESTSELLEEAGLSVRETLSSLRDLRDMSDCESTKLRVNETVLKLHGLMRTDEQVQIPNISIIINDNKDKKDILLPRELHKINETVQ